MHVYICIYEYINPHKSYILPNCIYTHTAYSYSCYTQEKRRVNTDLFLYRIYTACKYGTKTGPYLHDWTLYGINTVQKRVHVYMAFILSHTFT